MSCIAYLVKVDNGKSKVYEAIGHCGGEYMYWSKDLKAVNDENFAKNLDVYMNLMDIVGTHNVDE